MSNAAASGAELSSGEGGFQLVSAGTAIVHVWRDAGTARRLGILLDSMSLLYRKRASQIVSFCVLGREAPIPEPEVRTLLKQQFEVMRGRLVAAAFVLEKDGIEGVLSRTVLETVLTLARTPFQMAIFANVGGGAEWLARYAASPSSSVLLAAVERAEHEIQLRRPAHSAGIV